MVTLNKLRDAIIEIEDSLNNVSVPYQQNREVLESYNSLIEHFNNANEQFKIVYEDIYNEIKIISQNLTNLNQKINQNLESNDSQSPISKINLGLSYWNDGKPHYRIGMGAVAITVLRVIKAEEFLEAATHPLSEETIKQAAEYAVETAKPITDIRSTKEYRKQMAGVLLKRALEAIK